VTKNFTFKVNKWSVYNLNHDPYSGDFQPPKNVWLEL
jgi:hypothetical protein